jgi:hypothetical protein
MRRFGQQALDQHREIGLEPLAKIAASRPQEQVLGDLLADGAGAAHRVTMLIERVGLLDGLDVEAPVFGEFLIFRGHHGQRQIGRDAVQIHPAVTELVVGSRLSQAAIALRP